MLQTIDWVIIGGFFAVILSIGWYAYFWSGEDTESFFLSGRNMPWWLLGCSMVATTFSTDTPNLVADLVRTHGVSGNWKWWCLLLTGMLTVFIYAKLWRRSGVMTDIEFYELRYSGKQAAFLRGFRALYLGVFFNVMIMATVSVAAIKIGAVVFDFTPLQSLGVAMVVTVIYASLGGLTSVLFNDLFLFTFAIVGAVAAAVFATKIPEVGGLSGLFSHPNVADKLNLIPDFSTKQQFLTNFVPLMLIPIAVQWWSIWYPGSEPGGGGYMVQRMLSAKDEKNATGATLFFNIVHYAVRPWPWIIVALASLVVFPELQDIQNHFAHHIPEHYLKNDMAYPAMLSYIPKGWLGVVVASLIAAYMSTMASQLNWGSSYVVNDFYQRFIEPDASEKKLVIVGRITTVVLMGLTALVALALTNALQAFRILLQIGAGTGGIFILRWFWWRINAATEITGMVVSFLIAVTFEVLPSFGIQFPHWQELLIGVTITTISWLIATYLTQPASMETLKKFYRKVKPGGDGWNRVIKKAKEQGDPIKKTAKEGDLVLGIKLMLIGTFAVYNSVFATGYYLYANFGPAIICTILGGASFIYLFKKLPELEML